MTGLVRGETENAEIVTSLLTNLRDRGLKTSQPTLFCLDGSKALASAMKKVFGNNAVIQRSYVDKIQPMAECPFDRTLFLDSDTLMLAPCYELFELMDRLELAFGFGPWRTCRPYATDIPIAFPEPNTGMLVFRNSERVTTCLQSWRSLYVQQMASANPPDHDQPAFRSALYESDLQFFAVPPEYNLRTHMPFFAGGNLPVKILHGRDAGLSEAAEIVNRTTCPRIGHMGKTNRIFFSR